ncbi:hypothetical protein [uncultured Fluviicola sp.]|uniref:hypothetical protein n=1 Tax=uncultured Fluviicola sp. TaxID=463303 RepID=UPI0025DCC044|nr:hypothetical protein [uncultured Fluviicola sp.]
MKANILTLIQDDIKISRLTNTLDRLHVPANHYPLGNAKVIFSLLEIPETEQNFEMYYQLIEQAADLEQCDPLEKLEELAEGVFRELVGEEISFILRRDLCFTIPLSRIFLTAFFSVLFYEILLSVPL